MPMMPPSAHVNLHVLSSTGMFAIITLGTPGTHGAGVTGVHGTGVGTPSAAEVAAMKAGLLGEQHIGNGTMFVNGMLSMMTPSTSELLSTGRGVGMKTEGAPPSEKMQFVTAVATTC
jgi:hypothetical protein